MRTSEALSKESQRGDERCMFATVLDFVADSTGIIGVHLMERENPCAFCYYFFFLEKNVFALLPFFYCSIRT